MRKAVFATVTLIAQMAKSYHQSCLKQEGSIGTAEGDLISDFELLDLEATKDMRLQRINVCADK